MGVGLLMASDFYNASGPVGVCRQSWRLKLGDVLDQKSSKIHNVGQAFGVVGVFSIDFRELALSLRFGMLAWPLVE